MAMKESKNKKCKFCKSDFTSIRSSHVYCGHNCVNNSKLGRNPNNINGAKKTCPTCNGVFKSKGPAHIYCIVSCNINEKLANALRNRINKAIEVDTKTGSAVRDLGCTIEELKKYLEGQFVEGMSWHNHTMKGWHIDHIKPLASFDLTVELEFKEACHYTNLQPLWAKDNILKSNKLIVDMI